MSYFPDAEARRRVAEELKTTFVVRAGAGTGKTTVLLQRLLSLIRSGASRLDRIAAITFTEKAAGEMKVRLRAEIEAALRVFPPEGQQHVLREALSDLERAAISTIHAFCAGLLHERPLEARVDPGFTVLEELAGRLLRAQAWREWLTQELNTSRAVLKRALRLGLSLEHLEAAAHFVVDHRDCLDMLPSPLPSLLPLFHQTLREGVERLTSWQRFCVNSQDRAFVQIGALAEVLDSWTEEEQGERLLVQGLTIAPKGGNQNYWQQANALKEVRALLAHLTEERDKARRVLFHNLAVELTRWLTGYVAYYQQKKREQGLLDFTDLLLLTRDLLRSNKEVRRVLQQRYSFILVDEFQDTDPLQVEVVFFLAEDGARAEDWTEVELKSGKLFVVGDPCQSIYRFRRADMAIYKHACETISRKGEVVTLSTNFRARAPMVDWLNETFSRVLADGTQTTYSPLTPTRFEFHGKEVTLLPVPPERLPPKRSREEERRAEAETAAAFLKRVVEGGEISFWGEHGVRYGNIAILFRTHQAMEVYEEALRSFGIPYRVFGGRQFYRRQEISTLLALLRALETPWDKEALVAGLRSPLFGFSDEDLFLFTATGGALNYTVPVPEEAHEASRFASAFALLLDFHQRRNTLSPAALLEELYARTHLLSLFSLLPQGEQSVANLLKTSEIARSLGPQLTLHAFVYFLDEMERMGWEEGESPTSEAREDAVRLLTVHKAKGLEFPVVFLADVVSRRRALGRSGIIDRSHRSRGTMEVSLGPRTLGCETLGWQETEERERAEEEEEERRLLYVAATRARDHLVIPLLPGVRPDGFLGVLGAGMEERFYGEVMNPFGPEGPQVFVYDSRKLEIPSASSLSVEPLDPGDEERGSLEEYEAWRGGLEDLKKSGAEGEPVLAVTDIAEQGASLEFPQEKEVRVLKSTSTSERAKALRLGRLVHEVLRYGVEDPEKMEKLVRMHEVSEEEVSQVVELARMALSSPVMARARAAENRFHEVPFVYHHRGGLLEGIVDLTFVEDGKLVVVDFKTDKVARGQGLEERAEMYKRQGFLYALSFEEITGLKVKEVNLLFLRAQEEIIFPWGEEERRMAESWVNDF